MSFGSTLFSQNYPDDPLSETLVEYFCLFVAASHQTRLDTRSKARKPIKVGIKRRGEVGNEPRLESCWSMLLIGSLGAMWAWWGKQFHESKCGSGHVCRVMAWTRQQGLVPYIGFEKVRGDLSWSITSGSLGILISLYLVYRALLRTSLGNSVGVFFFWLHHAALLDYFQAERMFLVFSFFFIDFFPQISVLHIFFIYKLHHLFFHTSRIIV